MKKIIFWTMFLVIAQLHFTTIAQNITFNVDMTNADEFNPETDDVYLTGSFAGWAMPGTNNDLLMLPSEENPIIYSVTIQIEPPETIIYKYFRVINGDPSWDNGEWNGDPNRVNFITGGDQTFDDIWGSMPQAVEFLVDMSTAENFDPETDEVYFTGTFCNWAQPGILEDIVFDPTGIPLLYTLSIALQEGMYEYKYFIVKNGIPSWDNGEWPGLPNRVVLVNSLTNQVNDIWGQLFFGYEDDFELYTSGEQLACQNPVNWTTWSQSPCDATEDPFITDDIAFSGVNSVNIINDNNCIKPLDNYTSGIFKTSFQIFIPSGSDAYWSAFQQFSGPGSQLGIQVYFGKNDYGSGSVDAGGAASGSFSFEYDTWIYLELFVYLDTDWAELNINGESVVEWQWSLGDLGQGGINQIGGNNFYGWTGGINNNSNYYFDDYLFKKINFGPLDPPANLSATVEFNDVILCWEPPEFAPKNKEIIGYNLYRDNVLTEFVSENCATDYCLYPGSTHSYFVTAVYDEGESTPSNTVAVTIQNPLPAPAELTYSINSTSLILSWNEVKGLDGYNVYHSFNNGPFELLNNQPVTENTYVYNSPETGYHKFYTTAVYCDYESGQSNTVQVTITGINEITAQSIYLFPNPASNTIFINSDEILLSATIYDYSGRKQFTKTLSQSNVNIDISRLANGVYMLKLKTSSRVFITRLIKK